MLHHDYFIYPLNNSFVFVNQVIAAEGEQKASHSLKEAAMVIAESPSALQVNIEK